MANLDYSTLNLINKSIQKIWHDTVTKKTYADKIARKEIKATSTFTLKWLHNVPKLQQYNIPAQPGKPVVNVFGGKKLFEMEDYSEILAIPKKNIEDDDLSMYMDTLRDFGDAVTGFAEKKICNILNNGETTECMDGNFLFANDHDSGNGILYDNLLAGTGVSDQNIADDLDMAMIAMASFPDATGEARNLIPNFALVPPKLRTKFLRLLNSSLTPYNSNPADAGQMANNVFKGALAEGIESDAELIDDTDWFLFSSTNANRPFIHAIKAGYENVKPIPKISLTDDNVYYLDEFHWLIETHRIVVAGWPAYSLKIVNA